MPETSLNKRLDEAIRAVCAAFNLEPRNLHSVLIEPRSVTVVSFDVNETGDKFIGSNGDVAKQTRTLPFAFTEHATR